MRCRPWYAATAWKVVSLVPFAHQRGGQSRVFPGPTPSCSSCGKQGPYPVLWRTFRWPGSSGRAPLESGITAPMQDHRDPLWSHTCWKRPVSSADGRQRSGRSAAELIDRVSQIPGAAVPRLVGGGVEQLQIEASPELASSNRLLDPSHPETNLERPRNARQLPLRSSVSLLNRIARAASSTPTIPISLAAKNTPPVGPGRTWSHCRRRQQLPAVSLPLDLGSKKGVVHGSAARLFPADCLQMPGQP